MTRPDRRPPPMTLFTEHPVNEIAERLERDAYEGDPNAAARDLRILLTCINEMKRETRRIAKALIRYGEHRDTCASASAPDDDCTCGLERVLGRAEVICEP